MGMCCNYCKQENKVIVARVPAQLIKPEEAKEAKEYQLARLSDEEESSESHGEAS